MSGARPTARDLAALIERARRELPEPGDPRALMDDLIEQGLHGPEALEILSRTSLAWTQLRDMRLERIWQSGYGWFLARNAMALGFLILVGLTLIQGVAIALVHAMLIGIGAYYLLVCLLAPLRIRRHRHRRAGILENYAEDLGGYLDELAAR